MGKLSKRDFIKLSQYNPDYQDSLHRSPEQTAEIINILINTLLSYVKPKYVSEYKQKIKDKILELNSSELANKPIPQGARIGQVITILKNFLNGQDPFFIYTTLSMILEKL